MTMDLDSFFPRAARYAGTGARPDTVRESSARFREFPWTERHLQCVWFDPALRPAGLTTHDGEPVDVEDPGIWNLEAGPDFIGAALRVGAGRRRLQGDVEIHIHPRDWRAHAHRDDPRYARVRAHVTYFDAPLPADALPGGAIQVALRAPLAARGLFAFDALDVAAYPYAARAAEPPCQLLLRAWPAGEKELLLDAAGQERLRRKSVRLARRLDEIGVEQLLYEETLAVLGYKHNKLAFRRLASLVPLVELQEVCRGDLLSAQAALLGVSGLLPARPSARWDESTRVHLRRCWDVWFKLHERWAARCMEPAAWRTAGLRPANHPARRIAAAAALFARPRGGLQDALDSASRDPARLLRAVMDRMRLARDPFWDRHLGWGGRVLPAPVALIGEERIQLFVTNVLIPLLAAAGRVDPFAPALLASLLPEGDNQLVRQTAFNLFGAQHPRNWYRTGLRRQGLIQVFHDYCLNDRSRCAHCAFPELLRMHRPPDMETTI